MRKSLIVAAVAAVTAALSMTIYGAVSPGPTPAPAPAPAVAPAVMPAPGDPIITFGNQAITYAEFEAFISVLPQETQIVARGPGKRQVADEMVRRRLLADEARAKGLDKDPRFMQQLRVLQDNILLGLLLQDIQSALSNDAEIKAYYETNKGDFERVTVRHILLLTQGPGAMSETDAQAKATAIKKQLDDGADFAKLAGESSMDPGSKANGGSLPAFGKGQMVPEFEAKSFTLKAGEVSEPVHTDFGWHVIKLEKKETVALDEVKDDISDEIRRKAFTKLVDDLEKKAAPKLDEKFFGPPPAKAGAPAADKPADGALPPPTR